MIESVMGKREATDRLSRLIPLIGIFCVIASSWAHASPTGEASSSAIFLKPHPGTEITTRDRSYRCANPDGCYWEPSWVASGSDARLFLELTAAPLDGGKLDFIGWEQLEAGVPEDQLYPFRTLMIWQEWLDIENGIELRTFFDEAELLMSDDEYFRVGFMSAPDFWSNNFEMDIPSCMDTNWFDQEQWDYGWANGRIELNHHTKIEAFDMTGDGRKDIVMFATCGAFNHDISLGTENTGYLIVLEQTPLGEFVPANEKLFGQSEVPVGEFVGGQHFREVDDYNGDGRMDFVLAVDRDGGNDGAASGLWQSAMQTSEPYPDRRRGRWLSTDFLVLSQSDGQYAITSLGKWNKVLSAYRDSEKNWTIVNFQQNCNKWIGVIPDESTWSCEPPAALEVSGDNLIDRLSSVYRLNPLEESPDVPNWQFQSASFRSNSHTKQLKHHHVFDAAKRHLEDSEGRTISMTTRGGGVADGSAYFTLSVFGEQGPELAGATQENEHFRTFRYGGGWAGLTVYGNHYLPIYHEDYHLYRANPNEEPVILADIFGFRLAYFDQEELDALPGQAGPHFCGMDVNLEILGIPNGLSEEECRAREDVWAADRFYAAFSLKNDGALVALPLDQNPTYDDRFDWATQTHNSRYVEGGGQRGSHVAHFVSKPFKDVNGDGYEDYIEFDDVMKGNSWALRPDLCPDAIEGGWGPNWEDSSCRFVNLMVNDKSGVLRRVALGADAIPFELETNWQHFSDLNDDGVIDILNLGSVRQTKDIHNVLELGIYYGRPETRSATFEINLEEPVASDIHTGIGNLRGWAVADSGIEKIEIWIDGVYQFDVPYGGERRDVGAAFPGVENSNLSGFSMAFSYSTLTAGSHVIRAVAHDYLGFTRESAVNFEVVKFDEDFISDPDAVNLDDASCILDRDEITLTNAGVSGDPTDLLLKWRTAEQGFEITEIRGSGSRAVMESGRKVISASGGSGGAGAEDSALRIVLEEPIQDQVHSGVGNLRGWAVASDGIEKIEIHIDGEYAFDAPFGGSRGDVGAVFPDVPNSGDSGFSLAFAYGNLSTGSHVIEAVARTQSGFYEKSSSTFSVAKFSQSFISSSQAVDLSDADCATGGSEISISNALVAGDRYDMVLDWRVAEQGFEIVEIR